MPNLPSGCEYPNCPCTYPDCATRKEREEWKQSAIARARAEGKASADAEMKSLREKVEAALFIYCAPATVRNVKEALGWLPPPDPRRQKLEDILVNVDDVDKCADQIWELFTEGKS